MKSPAKEKPFRLWPVMAYAGKREESEPTQMFRLLDLPTDFKADQTGRRDPTIKGVSWKIETPIQESF